MTAKAGRLEARLTFAADVTVSVSSFIGSGTATVAAGSYYPTDLCSTFQTALNASPAGTNWTVTPSNGEGIQSAETGRVAIHTANTPWSITWTSTTLRDALGFTANIAAVTVPQTGPNHMKGMWLPGIRHKWSQHGDGDGGILVADTARTFGPTGIVKTLFGNSRREHRGIRWEGVPQQRVKAHAEVVPGESLESFYRDADLGRLSYIPVGTYVRLIWDADVDGTYAVGRLLWPREFNPSSMISGWVGRYIVEMPTLMVEV